MRSESGSRRPLRLAVYVDAVYRKAGDQLFSDSIAVPFLRFVDELGAQVGALTLIGRTTSSEVAAPYPFSARAELWPLPYYSNLRALPTLAAVTIRTVAGLWRALDSADVVLTFGPHPFGLTLALMAVLRRRPVVLGSREDTMKYLANRLPSPRWRPVLAVMGAIDWTFRALASRRPAVVVGRHLEAHYGGPRPGLFSFEVSLVGKSQIASAPHDRTWGHGQISLLSVGRVEPEKNPLLLAELMGRLEQMHPGRYHLTVVGTGQMLEALSVRCSELGLDDIVTLAGFVPFGDDLLHRYRQADAFIHTARTEAFGQVLVEAMASATPVVATDVGGVRHVLRNGRTGLLVPPDDVDALQRAVLSLDDEPARIQRVTEGLAEAHRMTLEATAERLAGFVVSAHDAGRPRR